jgi:ADP-heptose:LPS heptosyltransferase
MTKLLFSNHQSCGDIICLTAACRDIQRAYPGEYELHVNTSHMELWQNNPHVIHEQISPLGNIDGVRKIACHYPAISASNRLPRHFIEAFHRYLEMVLCKSIPITEYRGDLHLSKQEVEEHPVKNLAGEELRYWVVVAGGKFDYSAKWPSVENLNLALAMLQHFFGAGKMKFVQVGQVTHHHPRLRNSDVVDMIGRTDLRQMLQLIYHSEGVICPTTFAVHAAAAVPIKRPAHVIPDELPPSTPENHRPAQPLRPCVVIAGAREPAAWLAYPGHRVLENVGSLSCASWGGCWRSRAQKIGDGDDKDKHHTCLKPVEEGPITIAKCIQMISPQMIADAVKSYYIGEALIWPT